MPVGARGPSRLCDARHGPGIFEITPGGDCLVTDPFTASGTGLMAAGDGRAFATLAGSPGAGEAARAVPEHAKDHSARLIITLPRPRIEQHETGTLLSRRTLSAGAHCRRVPRKDVVPMPPPGPQARA